jgi:hypothetical protein
MAMPKEKQNEDIHLFIIEQEYKRKKKEQNVHGGSAKEAEKQSLTGQINPSVVQKLEEMHPKFAATEVPEPVQPTEEVGQVKGPQIEESINTPEILDLIASFQKMRTEEQELLETKEDLLAKRRDLQGKLAKEIDKKKIAIDVLKSEVQNLENQCNEMAQALGIVV